MENAGKLKVDDFLNHVGLRRNTKLTLKDVKVVKIYSSRQDEKDDIVFQFFTQLHAEDRQVIQKLHSSVTSQQTNEGRFSHISKRDVLFAMLNCFDPLLMQYVLHKLHLLGVAVPLLMPSVDNDEVYFLQWGLRPCFQHHALLDSQPTLPKYQFISVSAFRFGKLDFSKSDLLNKLLTNLQNNDGWKCFVSSSEDPEETVWSKGTLEITWCTIPEPTEPSSPFLLLNLRGDGHQYVRQQKFCINVSQIQIVFLSQFYDENLEHIYTMTETSHVIVVTNNTGQKEMKLFQNEKLTVIDCKDLSSQEISNVLSESLVEKIKATNKNFQSSVNNLTDTSLKLNFIDDEQKFQRARQLAEEIVNDVPDNFQDYKEQMLHFTKSFIGFDNIRDIDEDGFCRHKQGQCSREVGSKHIKNLLQCLESDINEQQIFFTSLNLYLQQKFGKRLQKWTEMYMEYYEEHKHFHKCSEKKEGSASIFKICTTEEQFLQGLNNSFLKVEHFLCLLWQYLRSSHSNVDNHLNSKNYNDCIKTWLMNGNSIDLVNFDSYHIILSWAVRLLYAIQTLREGSTCTRVVAAFGGNGAQSCRLLNQLFGTSFTQTDNLCSGGIRMQLIPIQNFSGSSLAFDYLLLLDINTIGLAEIVLESFSRMREYLLTLMSSITDVLIIYLNKDGPQVEESIMFDMVVHTALNFEQSVLSKCCVVYREMNSGYPNLSDLQSYTRNILEVTCNKLHVREPPSSKQTYSEKSALRKTVLSCFTNEGTINVKVLPKVQSTLTNQDYVKSINDIKNLILLLLQQCQREAFTLEEIRQTISSQKRNMSKETNMSHRTPFHKFVSPSFKITEYYVNSIVDIMQKVSRATATALTTIETAGNKQGACCRLQADVLELVNNEVGKVKEFLAYVGSNNHILSDHCNTLTAKLLKYKENRVQYSSNELQQILEIVRGNEAIDYVIGIKTREVLPTMKTVQEDESESMSVEEHLEDCIKKYVDTMKEEYPQTPLPEIKSRIKRQVTYELQKTKYGNHVNTLVETTNLADWSNASESTNSIDGVRKLAKRFNVEDTRVAKNFAECQESLLALNTDYANFTVNTEKVIRLLKRYLQSFQNSVDSLTMCIFLCIKFISGIHRNHARADMKSRNFSANEIDFENYVVKHVEPLNFPSFKSKLSYIVPLFATMIPGDEFSDLAKTLRSRSVTNYDHIPFNLITIQRLDRHFLWFLPVTSSQNVNNILHVVNDAKLYCLGRALGNSGYDFDDLFDYIFKLINHSLINGKDSEAIKAAAFVHVSAWSSPLISIKEYEKDSTTNVAYRAGKVVPILKLNILLDKQPLEKEFAKIFCDAMEDALLKCILQELQRKLREFLLQRSHVIFLKRSLIGRMLRSFCNQGDFEQFLSFVEDYDHCSRKYILLFLVTQINDGSEPLIWKLKGDVIEENITNAIQAVTQTTSHCVGTGDYSLCAWMQTFTEHFEGLNDKRFEYMEKHVNFNDVKVFAENCRTILRKLKHRLNDKIELPEKGNVDSTKTFLFSLSRNMHEEISTNIIGCIEQCPLCGNVCKFDVENHEYHSVLPHIPIGIKGGRDRQSDELISLTCPSLVSNNNIFTSLDLEHEEISKLSTFMKNMHPTWHVQDAENDPHVFWKYIFNRFNRQFAEFYECREGKLPPEWKEYSMEDAVRSVERTYKLDRNEFLSH